MQTTHTPKKKPETRLVLTITETADALGISRAHAYELVRTGELPSIRLGRRIVVPRVQLARLVGVDAEEEIDGEPQEPVTASAERRAAIGAALNQPVRDERRDTEGCGQGGKRCERAC